MSIQLRNLAISGLLLWVVACAGQIQDGPAAVQPAGTAMVSGRVTPAPGPAAAPSKSLRVAIVSSGFPQRTLEATVEADGSFRFVGVPQGAYIARVLAGRYDSVNNSAFYPARALFVGDDGVTNLELEGPIVVPVRIVIEGGGPLPDAHFSVGNIDIKRVTTTAAGSVRFPVDNRDSALTGAVLPLLVPPGEYQLTLKLRARFALRSMTSGSTDLLQESLVVTGVPAPEVLVTLTESSQPPAYAVRGRVTGAQGPIPQGVSVLAWGARTLDGVSTNNQGGGASVNPDGTFELQGLQPGIYEVTLHREGASFLSGQMPWVDLATTSVTVRDGDVGGIELAWSPLIPITVRVVHRDADGVVIPGTPLAPGITCLFCGPPEVTLTSLDGAQIATDCDTSACRTDILRIPLRADATGDSGRPTFLPPGSSTVRVDRLLPGTVVTSIRSGNVDLLLQPLVVNRDSAPVVLDVVVQDTGVGAVTVSGRVVTSTSAPLLPPRVTLRFPGRGGGPYQADVSRNGEYAFRAVPPGTYSVHANPDGGFNPFGSGTTNIEVSDRNVVNVPLVGLSTEQMPNTLQAANEGAAFQNLTAVSRAELEYRNVTGRYGTLADLIAAGLLSPGHAGTNSGYQLTVDATATDFTMAALPVTGDSGRYEMYNLSGFGGIRYLRIPDVPPARGPRTFTTMSGYPQVTLANGTVMTGNVAQRVPLADGIVMQPLEGCGAEITTCVRPGQPVLTTALTATGRVTVAATVGAPSLSPSTIYVGLASSNGGGTLTSVRADGSFGLSMSPEPGEYAVAVENLPPGFRVRSVTAGGVELANGTIKIADDRRPTPIDITIEYRQ